jgi:hypothetical protein
MSLRDLVDRKVEIECPGDHNFQVRGLSLEDVVLLLENHTDALKAIFASPSGTDFEILLKEFPAFVAAAIAYAADEHELEEQVRKLPVGIQLRAIQEVWDLSSLDVETLGKLAGSLLQSVGRLNKMDIGKMTAALKGGPTDLPKAQNS